MPESRRQHIATQWLIAGGGSVLRCYCGKWESDRQDTARAQRDAHRAHRVEQGETVAAPRPTVRERLKAAEADLARFRATVPSFAYDPEAGTAYVTLAPMPAGGVAQTVETPAMLQADLDEDGRLLGFEIIGALPGTPATPEEH